MSITDNEYFESIKNVFDILPSFFTEDTALALTDTEKFLTVRQASSFKLQIEEGMPIVKNGASEQSMRNKSVSQMRYPKEAFGFPIISRAVPIVNKGTGNALGTIIYAVSQEKESKLIEMAQDLNTFVEQLTGSAQEMAGSAEQLSESSQKVGGLISKASESINKMDGVLNYITEISNTTNLLGLNAAIEAARAGEQGRGFNVVAQEIRKLATQSKESVGDIANSLETIKNDINNILQFIDAFTSTSESQAAHAEQLSSSSEGINELSSRLLTFAEEINS